MSGNASHSPRASLKSARRCRGQDRQRAADTDGHGLDTAASSIGSGRLAQLRARGVEVVLVSSGAVAAGMQRLGLSQRPHALHELQAHGRRRADGSGAGL